MKSVGWRLRECKERVPSTAEGAALLLEYGVQISSSTQESSDTMTPLELKLYRYILSEYKERLGIYNHLVKGKYSAEEFLSFRSKPLVNICVTLAIAGQWEDIAYLFTQKPSM